MNFRLLRSYSSNKKQLTHFNESYDDLNEVDSGEPQGLVIDSILFLIVINYIGLGPYLFLFVDDTTAFTGEVDPINEALLNDWSNANKLSVPYDYPYDVFTLGLMTR